MHVSRTRSPTKRWESNLGLTRWTFYTSNALSVKSYLLTTPAGSSHKAITTVKVCIMYRTFMLGQCPPTSYRPILSVFETTKEGVKSFDIVYRKSDLERYRRADPSMSYSGRLCVCNPEKDDVLASPVRSKKMLYSSTMRMKARR